ncbi:hypothetical protein OpiT1DRAFT_00434 [Opitutaceae bacterium TAV1]|nr:hypothetical protein OpiT1DRAFT_00434 [Opitutaceae bacterium TAV1]
MIESPYSILVMPICSRPPEALCRQLRQEIPGIHAFACSSLDAAREALDTQPVDLIVANHMGGEDLSVFFDHCSSRKWTRTILIPCDESSLHVCVLMTIGSLNHFIFHNLYDEVTRAGLVETIKALKDGHDSPDRAMEGRVRQHRQAHQEYIKTLNPQERILFRLIGLGRSEKQICMETGFPKHTFQRYRHSLCEKLDLEDAHGIARKALQLGVICICGNQPPFAVGLAPLLAEYRKKWVSRSQRRKRNSRRTNKK